MIPDVYPKEVLDLALESGEGIVDLANRGKDYAKRFLDARGTYILVKSVIGNQPVLTHIE